MGRVKHSRRSQAKNKSYKKTHDTKRRRRDIDQIQDDIELKKNCATEIAPELDEDLPGLGQYYCVACARYFIDEDTLRAHEITKPHKRRYFSCNVAPLLNIYYESFM